jgi:peroxiredoxin
MRKGVLSIVVIIAILSVLFLAIGTVRKVKKHDYIEKKISNLPAFSFITLSNETFNSSEIMAGPVLIVHFHPECEHCQYEISEILNSNIPELYKKVILISSAHPDSIRNFFKKFNLADLQFVIALADTSFKFEEIFGSGIVPSSYIYNKRLELLKVLHGEVKTDVLINSLGERE